MPVFNGERFLEETLRSLLAQTYSEFELVIGDNASTDRTEEICRRFGLGDGRISYHRSPVNRGAAWNFCRAFALTRGELFKWAAYDDLCEPTFLERCVEALDAVPEAVLAYPKSRLLDDDGMPIRDHEDHLALGQATPHERLRALVPAVGYTHPMYGVIRSQALRGTRLLGAYPSSDYVLLAELALAGPFVEVPERLFLRRIHPQMSRQANPTPAAAAAWFRPGARTRFRAEAWRLCSEHLVAIARAPLTTRERLRCFLAFALVGGRRYVHHLGRELAQLVLAVARPSRAPGRKTSAPA